MSAFGQANDLARLASLHRLAVLDTEPEPEFDDLVRIATELCGVPMGTISFVDSERAWFKAAIGLSVREVPADISFCGQALHAPDMLIVADALQDPRFRGSPLVSGPPHLRFYAGVPLRTDDGPAVGTICVFGDKPHTITDGQKDALRALARQAVHLLELRRTRAALARYHDDDDLFFTVDAELRLTFLNEAAATAFGASPAQLLGTCVGDTTGDPQLAIQLRDAFASASGLIRFTAMPQGHGSAFLFTIERHPAGLAVRGRPVSTQFAYEGQLLANAWSRINDIVMVTEPDPADPTSHRISYVNEAFVRTMGYSAAEAVGRSPRFLHGPGTDAATVERIRESVRQGKPTRAELRNYTKAGAEIWLELDIAGPIADRSGRLTQWVAVERDITRRKREEALRQAESHVLRLVSLGATLTTVLEAITLALESAVPGVKASILLVGEDSRHLRHGAAPSLPADYVTAIDGIAIGPDVGSCGTAIHRRAPVIVANIETDPLWANFRALALAHGLRACSSVPVFDSAGVPIAAFAVYPTAGANDAEAVALLDRFSALITIAVEHARRDTRIRTSEERFKIVAALSADAIWDCDHVNETVWWSDGALRVFGHRWAEAPAHCHTWRDALHPDDRARVLAGIEAAMNGSATTCIHEHRLIRGDGSVAHVVNRAHFIRDATGRVVRVLGSLSDISQQRELEEILRQSQRLEAVGQLTGGIAHDFNNLLSIILGSVETLDEALAGDPALRDSAQMILTAADQGAALTRRLLAFSRRQALDPKATDIPTLVNGILSMLRRTLGEEIAIRTILPDETWQALVDAPQLESALLNLCLNARDAMAGGGTLVIQSGNVELGAADVPRHADLTPGDYVTIAVADTGCGMDTTTLAHAFEPFFTTKESGRGSGLGLSMVYGFTKQSRGHVRLESEPGRGTRVTLYLPRAVEPATQVFATPRPDAPTGGTETILVVEDNDQVRRQVTRLLSRLGYGVVMSSNGPEALEMLDAHPEVDLLFSDVVMPGGLNGRELAEAARQRRPTLPVLFMSGYSADAIMHDGRLDPGVHLLAKPFRRHELAAKLRELLDRPAANDGAVGRGQPAG